MPVRAYAEPHRLARPLPNLVENSLDAQFIQDAGDKVSLAHGHAAAQHDNIRDFENGFDSLPQHGGFVDQVFVFHLVETLFTQHRPNRGPVGQPDLVSFDRRSRRYQFITGRHRAHDWRPAHLDTCEAAGGNDCDVGWLDDGAGLEYQRIPAVIAAARMNELVAGGLVVFFQCRESLASVWMRSTGMTQSADSGSTQPVITSMQ